MTDCVIIFDNEGTPLDEAEISVIRTTQLSRSVEVAKGQTAIGRWNNKNTARNIKNGNFILVESSDGLPDWAGIMDPRTHNNGLTSNLTLYSAEWMLAGRYTDNKDHPAGGAETTAVEAFNYLIHLAMRYYPLPLTNTRVLSANNPMVQSEWHYEQIMTALNDLSEQSDNYWYLRPTRDEGGRLEFQPTFINKIGRTFARDFEEGFNLIGVDVSEEAYKGQIANIVTGFGKCADWAHPVEFTAQNEKSIAIYGPRQFAFNFLNIPTESALVAPTQALLRRMAFPYLSLTGIIPAPPYPMAGDTIPVRLNRAHGHLTLRRPDLIRMTVTMTSYDPATGSMVINATEIVDEDNV